MRGRQLLLVTRSISTVQGESNAAIIIFRPARSAYNVAEEEPGHGRRSDPAAAAAEMQLLYVCVRALRRRPLAR